MGGLKLEIKNLVKMFEPRILYQAYNLAYLQENTLTHICSHHNSTKHLP